MYYDNRKALPKGTSFEIFGEISKNQYLLTIDREAGRGGSSIAYYGTIKNDMGETLVDRPVIIKEFFPKSLSELEGYRIKRNTDGIFLDIPKRLQEEFNSQKRSFCDGLRKGVLYAGKYSDKALNPPFASGSGNGTFYAVSDVGKGEVLSKTGRESYTVIEALKIIASICDAIGALHTDEDEYKLYLDCKPSNIFVDGNKKAYLFDFDTVQSLLRYKFCSYSEGWGAPEQRLTEKGYKDILQIGFHTDMFSIGAVLLWLLTGIEGPTDEDLDEIERGFDWKKRITLDDPDGVKRNEDCIRQIDALMRKLLERDPEKRNNYFEQETKGLSENSAYVVINKLNAIINKTNRNNSYSPIRCGLPSNNAWFTGRKRVLNDLKQNYDNGSLVQILYGPGGYGKSQIARHYLFQNENQYDLIHWVDAATTDSIIRSYKLLLNCETKELQGNEDHTLICELYFRYLSKQDRYLVVYDNCDYYTDSEYVELIKLLPKDNTNGHVLITTRNKYLGKNKVQSIEVSLFSKTEAVGFLKERTNDCDEEGASVLAERLGRFPLALELAGAYINATPFYTIRKYLASLEKNSKILEQKVGALDYNYSLSEVVFNTLELIKKDCDSEISTSVIELLRMCACLSPNHISLRLFVLNNNNDSNDEIANEHAKRIDLFMRCCSDELTLNELSRTLVKYSLLHEEPDGFYSMHALQQEVLQNSLLQDKGMFLTYVYYSIILFMIYHEENPDSNLEDMYFSEHTFYNSKFRLKGEKHFGFSEDTIQFTELDVVCSKIELTILEYESCKEDDSSEHREYVYSQISGYVDELIEIIKRIRIDGISLREMIRIIHFLGTPAMMCFCNCLFEEGFKLGTMMIQSIRLVCNQFDINEIIQQAKKDGISEEDYHVELLNVFANTISYAVESELYTEESSRFLNEDAPELLKAYAQLHEMDDIIVSEYQSIIDAYVCKDINLIPEEFRGFVVTEFFHRDNLEFAEKGKLQNQEDDHIVIKLADGTKETYKLIDIIRLREYEYAVLLPTQDEKNSPGRVLIMKVEIAADESKTLSVVYDTEILDAIFKIFKERNREGFIFPD